MKSIIRSLRLSAIIILLGVTTVQAQDWPQWRGTNRDGKVTGFKAPKAWPQQLAHAWKVAVGLGDATPALVKDRLYVFTKTGDNEVLQCLDASTGKKIWQSDGYPATVVTGPAASHPGPRSSPAVSEGKVVTVGVAGDIACYEASTGKLIWRNEEFKGSVPQFFTGMSPLISGGVCYANLGGPQNGQFVAFDLSSGAIKWKTAGEGPSYASPMLLTVDGSKQIIFQSQTKLVSLNTSDGKVLWEYPTPIGTGRVQIASSPVIDQNRVYFTGLNNGVNAIEIKKQGNEFTVNKLWTNPDFSTAYCTPILKDGFLYAFANNGRLFCVNAANGQTGWSDDRAFQNFGSLVDAGSVIIALSSNSNMVVLKPDGQKMDQVMQTKVSDNTIYSHPVVSGNRIYIKDNDSLISYKVE
jgi:outer membrane protein assembly factor BamB